MQQRASALEFLLHRSQYIRLLFTHPPDGGRAIAYGKANFPPFYRDYGAEVNRLMTCVLYLPISRMQASPYADLASPSVHLDLEPIFAKEFCAMLGMSRQVPLRVVGDIGGGGALARIEKGRKVMRERKSEWSQTDELPVSHPAYVLPHSLLTLSDVFRAKIEVHLPAENRYHSIFACPVSKEQATEQNPPMMMVCGHCITRDSLTKLCKSGGYVPFPLLSNPRLLQLRPDDSNVLTVLQSLHSLTRYGSPSKFLGQFIISRLLYHIPRNSYCLYLGCTMIDRCTLE